MFSGKFLKILDFGLSVSCHVHFQRQSHSSRNFSATNNIVVLIFSEVLQHMIDISNMANLCDCDFGP